MTTRRDFIKIVGGATVGGLVVAAAQSTPLANAQTATPAPTGTPAATGTPAPTATPWPTPGPLVGCGVVDTALLPKPTGKRVVILGGGVGGAMCARTLRKLAPDVEVVVVEKNTSYVSGPYHVEFPTDTKGNLAQSIFSFDGLRAAGVLVIHATVLQIDTQKNRVLTSGGYIEYDVVAVATGIVMNESTIKGLPENAHLNAHSWEWGRNVHLRREVLGFKGGKFVVSVPPAPYKCPPGPYEVACLAQYYWEQNNIKAEIIILDSNDKPQPPPLADKWLEVFKARGITYKPLFKVTEFDPQNKTLISDKGEKQAYDLVSIIPTQVGASFIKESGLSYPFIDINPATYQSRQVENLYAFGDTARSPYTKSAFTAFLQGQAAAYQIAKAVGVDKGDGEPIFNQCWPYTTLTEAMLVQVAWDKDGKPLADKTKTEGPSATNAQARRAWESGVMTAAYG